MGWATHLIKDLQDGHTVECRPRGNSMMPLIKSGQLVTLAPFDQVFPGDIVLCRVRGREYVHLVRAVAGKRYLIGNNRGKINGWVGRNAIFGKVI